MMSIKVDRIKKTGLNLSSSASHANATVAADSDDLTWLTDYEVLARTHRASAIEGA